MKGVVAGIKNIFQPDLSSHINEFAFPLMRFFLLLHFSQQHVQISIDFGIYDLIVFYWNSCKMWNLYLFSTRIFAGRWHYVHGCCLHIDITDSRPSLNNALCNDKHCFWVNQQGSWIILNVEEGSLIHKRKKQHNEIHRSFERSASCVNFAPIEWEKLILH